MSANKNTTEQKKLIFLEALKANLNVVTAACEQTGIGRTTFYEWMKSDAEFKEKVEEISEIQIDFVETQLLKKIKEGSERSILFYMRYKARKRGYTDSIDITTAGEKLNGEIKIKFIDGNRSNEGSEKDDGNG
jgi:16S rRNA G527 N7-methylase RsmG